MTPKRWRERLLENRPNARQILLIGEDGFTQDAAIFWAGYKAGSFPELPPGLSPAQFGVALQGIAGRYSEMYLIDDVNPVFDGKVGPVAYAGLRRDSALVELEGGAFKWATPLNCLRCAVAFLHMQSWSKKVGVCLLKSGVDLKRFHDRLRKYGVLFYLGPQHESVHLYWVRGKFEA